MVKTTRLMKSKRSKYIDLAINQSPLLVPSCLLFVFVVFIVFPSLGHLFTLSRNIKAKESFIATAMQNSVEIAKKKKDLEIFRRKVSEFEKRLPVRIKTNLTIETLQEITKKSKVKFSSLEPAIIRKHILRETNDVFVELPIKVKLRCGYYDLVDFIQKIETADQLMKIADLSIKDDPSSDWEHSIEFSVSAFSRGDVSE